MQLLGFVEQSSVGLICIQLWGCNFQTSFQWPLLSCWLALVFCGIFCGLLGNHRTVKSKSLNILAQRFIAYVFMLKSQHLIKHRKSCFFLFWLTELLLKVFPEMKLASTVAPRWFWLEHENRIFCVINFVLLYLLYLVQEVLFSNTEKIQQLITLSSLSYLAFVW